MSETPPATPVTNLIWAIADAATDSAVGDAFLGNLVCRLSEAMAVRHVCVGEFLPGVKDRLYVRVASTDGLRAEAYDFPLSGTPYAKALESGFAWQECGAQEIYLSGSWRREFDCQAFVGLPLLDSKKQALGVIALLHDKALPLDENLRHVLRICASRTAAELERHRIESLLGSSEAHYRHLIESSPLAMLVLDQEQQIIFANAKFTELLGYTLQDVPNLDAWCKLAYTEQLRSKVDEDWVKRLPAGMSSGNPLEPMEEDVVCKDGSVRRVQKNTSFFDSRTLVVFTDLTDRVHLELELRQAQKLEVVGQLAGGVAHDFNNITQAILGFIGLAQDPSLNSADRDVYLKEALSAAKRASQLTRQLLAFGRRQPLHFEETNITELVSNLLKLLRRLIGEHIEVTLITGQKLGTVRCDRTQLEQVLINLCVNSRDAMPNGGRITIAIENKKITNTYKHAHPWAKVGHFLMISVADTGMGMDKATQERVFEPFFTTKPKDKGTGLGLSVVYGIVRQHEGFIRLYSEPGLGTTFRIFLPVVQSQVGVQGTDKVDEPAPGGSETILIAEDDDTIRSLVRRILMRAGYEVLCANNGEEAVQIFESNASRIDLLVFDAVMPRLGGFDAYERISRLTRKRMPAIFASGYNDAFNRSDAQLPPNCVLMQKPYDPEELLRQIRYLVSGAQVAKVSQPVLGA